MPGKRFKGECKIVFIPADVSEQITEETLRYTEETEVSCVQDHAKAHFRRVKPKKSAQQLAAQKEAMLAQIPEEQRKSISDALLNQSLDMGMVEHVSLLSNATDNNFTGVTFYCDDEAVACGLPHNVRASEIANLAGKPSEVRGDVFVARTFDNEDDFKRLDFTISEVSSRADWIKEARAQNERKMKAESANIALERLQNLNKKNIQAQKKAAQTTAKIEELSPAEGEKESGNTYFKRGEYEKALAHYSKAIELDSKLLVAYNNRAQVHLKLDNPKAAVVDADFVIKEEPHNVKALHRRASAKEMMGREDEALLDYKSILKEQPSNKVAIDKVKTLS